MRKNPDIHAQWAAVIGALCLLFIGVLPVSAQEAALGDSVPADTLAIPSADSLNADPEWYVAPVIPVSLRAPKRAPAAAASCTRVEAIQTFNIDSVLTEGTYYEYDAKGNVISTTVWTYNPDGTMTGKSKNEYAFDAAGTQTMTAVYIWDGAANDWKGTEKYEYVYKTFAGEKKMTSSTSSVWLNGAWVADQRFTYDYDASLREISYFEYRRNTSTNELQPVKGREQSWTDDLQTLEALYTAYANGKWTAGTKKEWAFDGNGTQTMYATYTISNGAWVGSSKETWAYNTSSKLTLHEKYGWAGNDWSITLQENTTYDASGNTTLIENYSWSNGIKTGTKKEQYSFDGGKPVLTMVYAWSNGAWIGSSKEVWNYNASSKLTLHEKYGWTNNDWSLTLQEKTVYSGANITLIENYTWSNGVKTGTKKEEYTYSGSLKTSFVTYSWAGSDWVGASKEIWAYTSGKQTLHETYAWGATDWSITLQENTAYSGANITLIENYTWSNGTKTGTQKEIWAYTSGKLTLHETYAWGATDWSITLQENTAYSGANITLIENYTWTNGTKTGTQKEEYAYTGSQKTQEIIYAWANDVWVETTKEVWGYTSGKLTHHEQYTWNGDWSKTLDENTTYDGANITKIENYTYSDGVKTGTQKEEYTYTSGEKTMTVVYAWANNDWVYSTKNEAGYRDGNVEVSATKYAWNGTYWQGTGTRTVTTYDGNNREVEVIKLTWPTNATEWTYSTRTVNTYNADGIKILSHSTKWKNDKWVLSSMTRIDIIKDNEGRTLLNASWKCSSDSVWKGVQKDTTAYSATGNWLFDAHYTSWKNNKWVLSYKKQRIYDDAGRLILDERYDWKNNTEVGNYKYEYAFDSQGRQTMSASYLSWSSMRNNWIGSSKNEVLYDANGQKEKEIIYTWGDGDWDYQYINTYQYDEEEREIEVLVQRWRNQIWKNFEKYEKEYRGSKLVKNNIYTWVSDQWQPQSRNELYYDDDSQAKLRREIMGAWNTNGEILSFVDNYYVYFCDPRTIRFVNYDGTLLEAQTLDKGVTPSYSGEMPTRDGNAEYSYIFAGWTPEIVPVTNNATYTATFMASKNTYTITWVDEAGNEIDRTTVEYGVMPSHEDAAKANTVEFSYEFTGWTPGLGIVTGDATYQATFKQTKNSYTITWKKEDGSVIETETLEYGVTPAHTNINKENTAEWTYTFAGWSPEIAAVTGDATYTATFTSTKNTYTVTWKNEDGSVIESEALEYGATPSHADITKDNTSEYTYTFAGWSPEIAAVTGDATYTATYIATKNSYTITWLNEDGTQIDQTTAEYGTMPTHEDASKANTAEYTYTFTGWTPGIGIVTGDATYQATFTATKNNYTIKFLNYNGEVLQSTDIEYGKMPEYTGVIPTKPADDQYRYAFAGWDKEIAEVVGEETYTATFAPTSNEYTISWFNDDNTLIDQTTVAYGVVPTHADATKENTAEFTYTFSGWDHEPVAVVGNASYTATFTATKNSYTITWLNEDGSEIESETLEYGATPAHVDIYKESTAEYTYTFSGWTPQVETVTGDAEYKATFTATKNTYTITWLNEDGSQISQIVTNYGEMPTAPADPTKAATAEYTYTFAGWTPAVATVTGDATYTATFTATERVENKTFTITFYYEDGVTVLDQVTVKYGETPSTSLIPSKYSEEHYYYSFAGWSPEIVPATGDASYTATYRAIPQQYTVTFKNYNGRILLTTNAPYGEIPVYAGETPAKPKDKQYTYTFSGWSPELTEVTGPATYTAVFEGILNQYTVLFLDEDGTELDRQAVDYGAMPVYAGETPQKEEDEQYRYTFKDWSPKLTKVTKDATYRATYTRRSKTEGLGDVQRDDVRCTKVLIDGQIYILRGDKTYTIQGMEVNK